MYSLFGMVKLEVWTYTCSHVLHVYSTSPESICIYSMQYTKYVLLGHTKEYSSVYHSTTSFLLEHAIIIIGGQTRTSDAELCTVCGM